MKDKCFMFWMRGEIERLTCVKAAREFGPTSSSQSTNVFINNHGNVGPGNIIPVNHDMESELRSSSGMASGSRSLSTLSTFARFGHFMARANLRRAFTWAFLALRWKRTGRR